MESFTIIGVLLQAVPWTIVIVVAWLLVKNDIRYYLDIKNKAPENKDNMQLMPLKLQAHERLVVFVERINPSNLFLRLYEQGMPLSHLQSLVLNEIRTEYQHNIAQQIYVKPATWNMVKNLKDDTLAMVNNAVKELPENSMGFQLSMLILNHMSEIEANPYELTQNLITKDMQELF